MRKPFGKRVRQTLVAIRDRVQLLLDALLRRQRVHYLHIGKTGGTAIKAALKAANRKHVRQLRFILHPHTTRLCDLPPGEPYVFSVRDPVTRFYSGFYSRKRKGWPRLKSQWTPGEAAAFQTFEHAEPLARALFDDDPLARQAWLAMLNIGHVRDLQSDWFRHGPDPFSARPPLQVIRQEHLRDDLKTLFARLAIDTTAALPEDPVKAHSNDYTATPALSRRAVANLRTWYAADIEFMRHVHDWFADGARTV